MYEREAQREAREKGTGPIEGHRGEEENQVSVIRSLCNENIDKKRFETIGRKGRCTSGDSPRDSPVRVQLRSALWLRRLRPRGAPAPARKISAL